MLSCKFIISIFLTLCFVLLLIWLTTFGSVYAEDGSKVDQSLKEIMQKLISEGLENGLLSVIESLLSATYPESMVNSIIYHQL